MNNDLYIKWETGEMLIHLDNFFPTSQMRLKKLLKIIELDWQKQYELKEYLKYYFQEKKAEHERKAAETCVFHRMEEHKRLAKRFQSYIELVK